MALIDERVLHPGLAPVTLWGRVKIKLLQKTRKESDVVAHEHDRHSVAAIEWFANEDQANVPERQPVLTEYVVFDAPPEMLKLAYEAVKSDPRFTTARDA